MKEGQILFNDLMVQAIYKDFKRQTRRVIDLDLVDRFDPPRGKEDIAAGYPFAQMDDGEHISAVKLCPYGQSGDRLWVRERVQIYGHWARNGLTVSGRQKWRFMTHDSRQVRYNGDFVAQPAKKEAFGFWSRPSIFMPRWASRITLEITNVRAERLHDMDNNDALWEGTPDLRTMENNWDLRDCFAVLWDSINAKRGYSWTSNPWVWALEFKRMK